MLVMCSKTMKVLLSTVTKKVFVQQEHYVTTKQKNKKFGRHCDPITFSLWDTMFWKTLDASNSIDRRNNKKHIVVQIVEIIALKFLPDSVVIFKCNSGKNCSS